MKLTKLLLVAAAILCIVVPAEAQRPETGILEEYASPSVVGMGKGKGIVIGYERLPRFDIKSYSKDPRLEDGQGRVRRHNKFDVKINAPVLNKPQTKVIFGIDYKFEEFNFEDVTPESYDLYQYLEDRNLQSVGAQVVYLHSIDSRRFYLVRLRGELNGDFTKDDINSDLIDYFKPTVDIAYGWKKSPNYAIGVGLQLGYTFGRASIYPALLYNRTFNNNWGIEAIFPANARVRYNVNEKTLLFAGYRLEGASYNLYVDEGSLSEFGEIELSRTDVKGLLRVEREIYDFLWFGVEGGFRQYYRNRVFDEAGSRDEILDNDLFGAGFVKVELFVVPPRRLMEKNK